MDMFSKAAKTAKEVGDNVITSAKDFGENVYNTTKGQSELASMNIQKTVLEKKLEDSYAQIGKRYVEYMANCEGGEAFDVSDICEAMAPQLEKLNQIKDQIAKKEAAVKEEIAQKAKKKAQDEFDSVKVRLDKALAMDIVSREEYDAKLMAAQKRLDNYDLLRKIDMQLDMGIINKEEYKEKIAKVLS